MKRVPPGRSLSLADVLSRAIVRDERAAARLASAKTVVAFSGEREEVVVLLDRDPPRIATDGEPAEVKLYLREGELAAFMRGRLNIPLAVMRGTVDYEGAVRKYLVVDAVLRAQLGELAVDEES